MEGKRTMVPEQLPDKLDDIFMRNKKFTDYSRANSPREDTPEKMLKLAWEDNLISKEDYDKAILEMKMIRNGLALYGEVAEYIDELPWKWWGRGKWEVDRAKAIEELIDLMHFIMVAFDDLNCGPEEIYKEYVKKNDENWERFAKKKGWGDAQR